MYRKIAILLVALLFAGVPRVFAQLSDAQIIEYIATNISAGKSERQIVSELQSRGVSTAQLQRLLKAYKSGEMTVSGTDAMASSKLGATTTERKTSTDAEENLQAEAVSAADGSLAGKIRKKTRDEKDEEAEDQVENRLGDILDEKGNKIIYGHNIFSGKTLSFEPNVNVATPEDYVLGPGDEVIIDIWGLGEASLKEKITPEGHIMIPQVGKVVLSGLTVKQATGKLHNALGKAYGSLRDGSSQMSVSLGDLRTIQVNVLGEVQTPGTFRLSSFTTLFNALYRAGGVTPVGSLRNVKVVRAGKTYAEVDIYRYLFEGKIDLNVPLKEGDVVIVPPYEALVSVTGAIKRPMFYEMKEGEPVGNLISYAGGFTGNAWQEAVEVERNDGRTNSIHTVTAGKFDSFALRDGDAVLVSGSEVEVFRNRVEVKGAVYRPGRFELGGDIATVGQLVSHAGGVLEDAFLMRAQIIREKADRSLEMVSVPLGAILDGNAQDILLQRGDILVVANINEIEPKGDVTVTGYVALPGKYEYAEHMTVEDVILLAGGLSEGASSAKVDISRRIDVSSSTAAHDTLAQVFSVSIQDGLAENGAGGFELMPNDIVSVRKSPTYVEQRNVTISGEVTFPGQYTLVSSNERVSDLVARAGGSTPNGNVRGAMLKRKVNQYERNVRIEMSRLARQTASSKDSLNTDKLMLSNIYTVGLELDKALASPGSDYDLVLRDGDELIIPEITSTVRIQGEVLYPNTVHFISGKSVAFYVREAGGYTDLARRAKVYVVYMNGTVAVGNNAKLEPGCEIIVPARAERHHLSTGEWLGIGTSAASIGTMVATLVNLLK